MTLFSKQSYSKVDRSCRCKLRHPRCFSDAAWQQSFLYCQSGRMKVQSAPRMPSPRATRRRTVRLFGQHVTPMLQFDQPYLRFRNEHVPIQQTFASLLRQCSQQLTRSWLRRHPKARWVSASRSRMLRDGDLSAFAGFAPELFSDPLLLGSKAHAAEPEKPHDRISYGASQNRKISSLRSVATCLPGRRTNANTTEDQHMIPNEPTARTTYAPERPLCSPGSNRPKAQLGRTEL